MFRIGKWNSSNKVRLVVARNALCTDDCEISRERTTSVKKVGTIKLYDKITIKLGEAEVAACE